MVNYWGRQHVIDVFVAVILALVADFGPKIGLPVVIRLSTENLTLSARAWVGPSLTLLGMMSATTAFIFSVVDRNEFKALRELGVEPQLWKVFSENILWLAIAAVSAMVISFIQLPDLPDLILLYVSFLFFMVTICLLKFAWIMRQIISVRASK